MTFTPMIEQYRRVKDRHRDAILFFRLGDFYEMFFEDAEVAARELEIALTARDGGHGVRVPMCGVPVHAAEGYIARLVDRGHKVAICEQVEDPRQARGLVRREVVRVITPGTLMDARLIGDKRNRYLAALASGRGGAVGLAWTDISTGEFLVTDWPGEEAGQRLWDELARLKPAECLLDVRLAADAAFAARLAGSIGCAVTPMPEEAFARDACASRLAEHFGAASLSGLGLAERPLAVQAAGALLQYLQETQRGAVQQVTGLRVYAAGEAMPLDTATRRNLELVARLADGERQGSLLSVLDRTVTAMGGRLLRQWVEQPLVDVARIRARLDAVEELAGNAFARADVREALKGIYDLERLVSRVACGSAGPRDLVALRLSLERLPSLAAALSDARAPLLAGLAGELGGLQPVAELIARALVDDPPAALHEGGVIREGYDAEVDALRRASGEGKAWIAALEAAERERTGIRSLKVGYNKVFGYYIEVTHANRNLVPPDYIRKQTLAGAERYITPELKEREEAILGASERLQALEERLFVAVRAEVGRHTAAIQAAARAVAALDALAALAEVAVRNNYVRPEVDEGLVLDIRGGRHPVLEQVLGPGGFVPNDAYLDGGEHRLAIVTGPNMAGKSSFARQVALIVIMAQMGSFVPADSCRIGLVDRVFTRIGAGDDLFGGQSTFMVEMSEVANILRNATARSLVILDEVGRGTSTCDGLSIAWAVSEHLHDRVRARTIFTTHYHELTALEELLPGAKNYTVVVREQGEDVIFLHRVVRGGSDRSYGIQVARLAGLPREVLRRAMEVLRELEQAEEVRAARQLAAGRSGVGGDGTAGGAGVAGHDGPSDAASGRAAPAAQLSLLPEPHQQEALRRLLGLNILEMTPLEALNQLHALQTLARGG